MLRHGGRSFSQGDEDGILTEILRRIGPGGYRFVEWGAGDGLENNTRACLLQGWRGAWVEGDTGKAASASRHFEVACQEGRLRVLAKRMTLENAAAVWRDGSQGKSVDIFSLDLDGNDAHLLQAIPQLDARVLIVEYNAALAPPIDWVMPYRADHSWDGSDYYGASLSAWVRILGERGYALVGCSATGVNAFFVRKGEAVANFAAPFTAENHYEPARYLLLPGINSGHPSRIGFG